MKAGSNAKVFENLINELNDVKKEGIIVNINGLLTRVKFQLILLLGDNLGLNTILSFVAFFGSNFYCICQYSSQECKHLTMENKSKLRTVTNYKEDIKKNNYSKTGKRELHISS